MVSTKRKTQTGPLPVHGLNIRWLSLLLTQGGTSWWHAKNMSSLWWPLREQGGGSDRLIPLMSDGPLCPLNILYLEIPGILLPFSQIQNYIWFKNNQKSDHLSCSNLSVWYTSIATMIGYVQPGFKPWTGRFLSHLAISSLSGAIILWSIHLGIGTIPWTSGNHL